MGHGPALGLSDLPGSVRSVAFHATPEVPLDSIKAKGVLPGGLQQGRRNAVLLSAHYKDARTVRRGSDVIRHVYLTAVAASGAHVYRTAGLCTIATEPIHPDYLLRNVRIGTSELVWKADPTGVEEVAKTASQLRKETRPGTAGGIGLEGPVSRTGGAPAGRLLGTTSSPAARSAPVASLTATSGWALRAHAREAPHNRAAGVNDRTFGLHPPSLLCLGRPVCGPGH